jgi:enamine deaminase RidA (YjgF/YER057c/UK114 family)
MTSFVHTEYSTEHAAVVRAENLAARVQRAVKTFSASRATASLLLAAVVAALVVTANQMIETWTDGHLMAAWMVLWAVAFTASALLTSPVRSVVNAARVTLGAWQQRRREVAADHALWNLAQMDSRVMADISRAMARDLPR